MLSTRAHQVGWYLWLLLVALAPASTKIAGAAWLVSIAWSFWLAHTLPVLEARTADTQALYRASSILLIFFGAAFVLRTIGQAYWWDNWEYRHFDARMLFTALALYLTVRRVRPSTRLCTELIIAVAISSIATLYVSFGYMQGGIAPTNVIPWAYGVVLFAVVLASVRWMPQFDGAHSETNSVATAIKFLAPTCAVFMLVAILLAGVRGAYFAVLWVVCVLLYGLLHTISLRNLNNKYVWLTLLVTVISLGALIQTVPQVYQTPKLRIEAAIKEIGGFQENQRNSSVGLRLHFLEKGVETFTQNPWLGIGIEQRRNLVDSWANAVAPALEEDLTHTHNEYLNAVLDYGVAGGLATLCYLFGLFAAALIMGRAYVALSLSLAGFGFATLSTFLTNANTLHNFSSVSLGLVLLYAGILFTTSRHVTTTSRSAAQ
jgi:O-antigen ligase